MGPICTFDDLIDILRRRARVVIMVTLLGSIASVIWAFSVPHVYQSSEAIQVKLPKVSSNLAPSTVEGSSFRRLQLIEQKLLARENLIDLIEKYDLYTDMTALRMSEKVDLLRRSITITGVGAVGESSGSAPGISVLTFIVEMNDPADAQAVARDFADQTRTLAAAQRREQTREALDFFMRQDEKLIRDIAALEEERANFQAANDLALEGSLRFRQDEISNLNNEILDLDREITATRMARARVSPDFRASTIARAQAELDAALENLNMQRNQLRDQRDALRASLQTSPELDRELTQFARRLEQLQTQWELTVARRIEAEVGFSLEVDGSSEKLATLEAAELPEYPISPNRIETAVMGGVASAALAFAVAVLLEMRHPVIRTAQQMHRKTGLMPVISIPDLSPPEKPRVLGKLWQKRVKAGQKGRPVRQARKNARQS